MIIGLVILAIYAIIVLACFTGVLKFNNNVPRCHPDHKVGDIHVIISIYNDAGRVESLIEGLKTQTYKDFKVILIDDGSTDATLEKLNQFTAGLSQFKVIALPHQGKDLAIRSALDKGTIKKGLVVITDADCRHPQTWIETIAAYAAESKASMLIAPVKIEDKYPFQATEYLSVQAMTIGSANLYHPLMCGGANLAFTIDAYNRVKETLPQVENGTDMFLLEAIKKSGELIEMVNSTGALIETGGADTIGDFFRQRRRWAGKGAQYTDREIIAVGILTLVVQFVLIAALIIAVFVPQILLLWLLKFIIDFPLLTSTAIKFHTPKHIALIPVLSLVYPFYVFAVIFRNLIKR